MQNTTSLDSKGSLDDGKIEIEGLTRWGSTDAIDISRSRSRSDPGRSALMSPCPAASTMQPSTSSSSSASSSSSSSSATTEKKTNKNRRVTFADEQERHVHSLDSDDVNDESEVRGFEVDQTINEKIILWHGDICQLDVDVLVNTTNEKLNERAGVSGRIFAAGGTAMVEDLGLCEGCPTGDVVTSGAHRLHAKLVVHTVGPRYSVKYQTAAENALHGCYRKCLEQVIENKFNSVALPMIVTKRKLYPTTPATHVALRTIRRFLEKHGKNIDTIVFALESATSYALYNELLPLYFPRSERERCRVAGLLPSDLGNDDGETVIESRRIRITSIPGDAKFLERVRPITKMETVKGAVIKDQTFVQMQQNPDDLRKEEYQKKSKAERKLEEIKYKYQRILQLADDADLSDLEALNFIFPAGKTKSGSPVIFLIASRLDFTKNDLDRIRMHIIKFMEPLVGDPFHVIFFMTNSNNSNKAPFSWVHEMYTIFDRRYKKNMKRLFIVHPTFWIKLVSFFVKPFIDSKAWKKIVYITELRELYHCGFSPRQLQIPPEITEYDAGKFGAIDEKKEGVSVVDHDKQDGL